MLKLLALGAWLAAIAPQTANYISHPIAAATDAEPSLITDDAAIHDEGKESWPCGHAHRFHAQLNGECPEPGDSDQADPRGGDGQPREAEGDTDVQHYLLDIEIIPEYVDLEPVAVRVQGISNLSVRAAVDGLTTFTVDLGASMTVNGVTGDVESWIHAGDAITITLDRAYNMDEIFHVAVDYAGYPDSAGFGAFEWWTRNGSVAVGTLSEPYYARLWWPCKDRLNDKATMQMQCTVPDPMVVASNGMLEGADALPASRTKFRWHEINPMVTYLASLAITDYQVYELEYDYDVGNGPQSMPVLCYLYPDHWDAGLVEPTPSHKAGCDELLVMLETFGAHYGPYPFLNEKYGVAETGGDGGLGANMEHQTISSMSQVSNFSDIMAHELAHHWWGDLVTCATWHDIWLNEGLTSHAEAIYREFKPDGGISSYWSRMNQRRPANPDGKVYRSSINSVGAIFSTNDIYNKGAWVTHMLRHVMGDAEFFQAMLDYRAAYANGFATTADFAASMSASFGHDLTWFTDQWVMSFGSPRYEWRSSTFTLNGQTYLKLLVSQTQDSLGFGLFKMPIDIRVTAGAPSVKKIWNDNWDEYYVIPINAVPTNVEFDEDSGFSTRNWILWAARTQLAGPVAGPPVILSADIDAFGQSPGETRAVITFSENVGSLDASDMALTGTLTGAHVPASVTYSAALQQATIVFDQLPNDEFELIVHDEAVIANSLALDGEIGNSQWYDPALFPSGDGQPGGDAEFSFALLAGDADCDGALTLNDVDPFVAVALGIDTDACHVLRSDANNDGFVDGADVQLVVDALLN